MDLVLFTVFFVVALAFFSLGKLFKAFFFVAGAGLLLSVLGVISIHEGLYYQVVNETTTSFSFSPDYFEFANDSVGCHNCTAAWNFTESWNATPPSCCEHDVNTTISGSISQAETLGFATRALDHQQSTVISLSFVLFGLAAFIDVGIQYLRERKKKESEQDDG